MSLTVHDDVATIEDELPEAQAVNLAEEQVRVRIRDAAIEITGRRRLRAPLRIIAEQAGLSPAVVLDYFGSRRQLLLACDEYIAETSRLSKSQAIQAMSPDA